jgi:hypothetical protein
LRSFPKLITLDLLTVSPTEEKKPTAMVSGSEIKAIKFMEGLFALVALGLSAFSVYSYFNMVGLLNGITALIGCGIGVFAVSHCLFFITGLCMPKSYLVTGFLRLHRLV